MKSYKGYLFDWDGTLAKTLEVWLEVLRESYEKYGIHVSDKDIKSGFGDWRAVMRFGLAENDYIEYMTFVKKLAHERQSEAPLYEGVTKIITNLRKQNKKVALLTSSHRQLIDAVLAHHNFVEQFDIVITGSDVENHKPHPESIEQALKFLKLKPNEVVMVGDSDKDLGAAKSAGVDSYLFYPKSHENIYSLEDLKSYEPTRIFNNWLEF